MGKLIRRLTIAALVLSAACTTSQQTVPPLAGPSEFALSLRVTATPDSISQDGASQSSIVVNAFDPNGRGVSGLALRMDMAVNGLLQDYGTLSARTIVTGTDGRATTVYTAPIPPPPAAGGSSTIVTIVATPTGNNFQTSNPQIAAIRLVPPGVILPGANTPTAKFTFSSPVNVGAAVLFDGSGSCPRGVDTAGVCLPPSGAGATITNYLWSFGDGSTATGQTAAHTFTSVGTFNVTLTVTNDRGVQGSSSQIVSTTVTTAPSGDITISPTSPVAGDAVLFNADGILAAPGHSIVQYSWDFGDPNPGPGGNTASTSRASHVYGAVGSYNVLLSVLDDTGQKKSFTKTVAVTSGNPRASFTFAVTNPASHTIQVDASGSSAAGTALIATYAWTWGDSTSTAASGSAIAPHSYPAAGSYPVTLTVTDTLGRVGTFTQTVAVP
jgi:PKD repeat protein